MRDRLSGSVVPIAELRYRTQQCGVLNVEKIMNIVGGVALICFSSPASIYSVRQGAYQGHARLKRPFGCRDPALKYFRLLEERKC